MGAWGTAWSENDAVQDRLGYMMSAHADVAVAGAYSLINTVKMQASVEVQVEAVDRLRESSMIYISIAEAMGQNCNLTQGQRASLMEAFALARVITERDLTGETQWVDHAAWGNAVNEELDKVIAWIKDGVFSA